MRSAGSPDTRRRPRTPGMEERLDKAEDADRILSLTKEMENSKLLSSPQSDLAMMASTRAGMPWEEEAP